MQEMRAKRVAHTPEQREHADELSNRILDAAIEVHQHLGPGLLESVYEVCLAHGLGLRGLQVQRQVELPVRYKGCALDAAYRLDILVENLVLVEVKAVDRLHPIHEAQTLTYLRLSGLWLGLLLNFNVPIMREGIKRLVNG